MPQIHPTPEWLVYAAVSLPMLSVAGVAPAQTCAPEPQGEGQIAAIIDARTIRLDDGRQVRLAGLAAIWESENARQQLSLHLGAKVSLHSNNEAPDRYGRQHAVVFPAGSEASLQVSLLTSGAAVYDGLLDAPGCREEFTAAEGDARRQRVGLWGAAAPYFPNPEQTNDIIDRLGYFAVIEGEVRSVRQSGGTSYLNFSRRWTQGFAVTISSRSRAAFEAAGMTLAKLEGQRIRVRGIIDMRGGPRIDASRLAQVELAGTPSAAQTTIRTQDRPF